MNTTGIVKKALPFELEGRGTVTLRPVDHMATGGEGSVYKVSNNTLIKLYSDSKKMLKDSMVDKLKLLSLIKHPYIIAPEGIVFQGNKPVGYYMKYVKGEPLARVFTSGFRQRENFGDKEAKVLIDGLRTVIQVAHAQKAVLVDANEFNWLLSMTQKKVEPRIIDVDSWAIDRWKASVIMPSIRDWHSKEFNEQSDWFAFAIVSFQVLVGVHPYKGMLPGYKPNDLEKRMKDNKSVFTKDVRLNSAVRDFSSIPARLLDWYQLVFEKGERSIPPSAFAVSNLTPQPAITKRVIVTGGSTMLILDRLYDAINDIPVQIYPAGVVRLSSGKLINLANGRVLLQCKKSQCEVVSTDEGFLVVETNPGEKIICSLVTQQGNVFQLDTSLSALKLFRYQNRMFVVTEQGLVEITVKEVGKPLLVIVNVWQVMVNSTQWFDGLGIQDSLGASYIVTPFGNKAFAYIRCPELDKKKIVDGKAGSRYAVVVALNQQTGVYEKYEFTFDNEYTSYSVRMNEVVTSDLNIALLQKGVVASIPEDGNLIISVPFNGQEKLVTDSRLQASWLLDSWGDRVVYIDKKTIWSMRLK